ncbi:MAG: SDR family oxidoreductase [Acidobacteriota bacterium]|nr:SDR family oxidoreductase [Acidobacteriota bacterium]
MPIGGAKGEPLCLRGRSAIITGGSTGLGQSIARAFLAEGANVAICAREPGALEETRRCLIEFSGAEQRVLARTCDVSQEDQVRQFIAAVVERFARVDILINNAGVLGPIGKTEEVEISEWRRAIDINLFGTVMLCSGVVPQMRSNSYGKIVNLSGGGATSPRPFHSAYATAKAAVVRFTENLAEELRDTGIDVNSIAPGALNTRMLTQSLEAGAERMGEAQFSQALRQKETGGSSFEKAAALCVYLSSAAADGITGKLISAPWDPWPTLHEHLDELRTSDIYTLRRVVPEDRGKHWNE